MRKPTIALCCLSLALLAAGCGMAKAPAQAAIGAADQALNTIREEAVKYVPTEFAGLEKSMTDAKAALEKGEYAEALTMAKDVPGKVNDLYKAIEVKKAQLPIAWQELAANMPKLIADAKSFVAKAKGADKAALDAAKTDVKGLDAAWAKAEGDFKAGNIFEAVAAATGIKEKVEQIKANLAPKVAERGK